MEPLTPSVSHASLPATMAHTGSTMAAAQARWHGPPSLTASLRTALVLQLAKEYGMDFYETSACTNLNIKEVRTPGTATLSLAEPSRRGGGEEVANRSQDKMGDPFHLGQRRGYQKQRMGITGLTCAPRLPSPSLV